LPPMKPHPHPNEPGQWSLVETRGGASLWKRDRLDPLPVTMFYVLSPPAQTELFYDEMRARDRFEAQVQRVGA
jgi:hypothetical protein